MKVGQQLPCSIDASAVPRSVCDTHKLRQHQRRLPVFRELSEQVQTELANANSVADEVLSSMTTVRAHAAEDSAKAAYGAKLLNFYSLQVRFAPCSCKLSVR